MCDTQETWTSLDDGDERIGTRTAIAYMISEGAALVEEVDSVLSSEGRRTPHISAATITERYRKQSSPSSFEADKDRTALYGPRYLAAAKKRVEETAVLAREAHKRLIAGEDPVVVQRWAAKAAGDESSNTTPESAKEWRLESQLGGTVGAVGVWGQPEVFSGVTWLIQRVNARKRIPNACGQQRDYVQISRVFFSPNVVGLRTTE
jgi:hypothetical protein